MSRFVWVLLLVALLCGCKSVGEGANKVSDALHQDCHADNHQCRKSAGPSPSKKAACEDALRLCIEAMDAD